MNSRLGLALAIGLLLAGCLTLDSFLFEPHRIDEYLRPEDMHENWHVRFIIPDTLIEPVTLESSGGNRIYGFFVRPLPDTARELENATTVIYCHGNAVHINRFWGRVELLWEAGFRVFIFDYQGYGRSEGSPSGEACYADARAALEYCRGREDVFDSLLVYYGMSLGTWVATYLAADVDHPLGLVLESPYASTTALLQEGALLRVPGGFAAVADFDNERRLPSIGCPLMMIYGEDDEYAVPERHEHVLADIAESWGLDLTELPVPGGVHDDAPEKLGYEEYERAIREFVAHCAADTTR
jgi:pimeloyl-ACP methyl ester carboxylesterase